MEKWEYKIVRNHLSETTLNALGLNGWELCEILDYSDMAPFYYFKRKIED